MCLTGLMICPHPKSGDYQLIMVFNRDEFYSKPTKAAGWDKDGYVISGQDMVIGREGGTWLGCSRRGRLAMLLNIIQTDNRKTHMKGRGFLVVDFLHGSTDGQCYAKIVLEESDLYEGFNLITIEFGTNGGVSAFYCANDVREGTNIGPFKIKPGVHAFSNHTVNTSWQKTDYIQQEMEQIVERARYISKNKLIEELLTMMQLNQPLQSNEDISNEDLDFVRHGALLKELVFVKSRTCGTRTTTVILIDGEDNVSYTERTMSNPIDPCHPKWNQQTHVFTMKY